MNIIAVDDEKYALLDLKRAIQKAVPGSDPFCFMSAAEAISCARELPVDVAFLDIKMNEMNGVSLAAQLKQLNSRVNIIFVTGYSDYASDAFELYASGYVLKPAEPKKIAEELNNLRYEIIPANEARVHFKCFGNFEILLDGKPIVCTRSKAKELLAYLVDRRGNGVTSAEICSIIWENRSYDRTMQKIVQNTIRLLVDFLKAHSIGDIMIRKWNYIAIDVTKVKCDYYDFLNGIPSAISAYEDEYMSNYSWAEFTAAKLTSRKED